MGFLPDAIRSLWLYTYAAYRFHAGLTQRRRQPPPVGVQAVDVADVAAAGALLRSTSEKVPGCGAQSCVKAVMLVGTPAMWLTAVPVLAWGAVAAFAEADWRYGAVLVGYGAGFLPWLADIDRQMYFFYAATMSLFLVMAIGDDLRRHTAPAEPERRAKNAGPDSRQLLCGPCDHELRPGCIRFSPGYRYRSRHGTCRSGCQAGGRALPPRELKIARRGVGSPRYPQPSPQFAKRRPNCRFRTASRMQRVFVGTKPGGGATRAHLRWNYRGLSRHICRSGAPPSLP